MIRLLDQMGETPYKVAWSPDRDLAVESTRLESLRGWQSRPGDRLETVSPGTGDSIWGGRISKQPRAVSERAQSALSEV